MSTDYWVDSDWPDPYDTNNVDQCVYLYCYQAPKCTWRTEVCGSSLGMLQAIAADHERKAHDG